MHFYLLTAAALHPHPAHDRPLIVRAAPANNDDPSRRSRRLLLQIMIIKKIKKIAPADNDDHQED